jgi:hypothetical protein
MMRADLNEVAILPHVMGVFLILFFRFKPYRVDFAVAAQPYARSINGGSLGNVEGDFALPVQPLVQFSFA